MSNNKYNGCNNFKKLLWGSNNHVYVSCHSGVHKLIPSNLNLDSIYPNGIHLEWGLDGYLYTGKENTVYIINPTTMNLFNTYTIPNSHNCSKILFANDGNLYIGVEEGYIYKVNSSTLMLVDSYTINNPYKVTDMVYGNDNNLYAFFYLGAGTSSEIKKINPTNMTELLEFFVPLINVEGNSLLYHNNTLYATYSTYSDVSPRATLYQIDPITMLSTNVLDFNNTTIDDLQVINNNLYITSWNYSRANINKINLTTFTLTKSKRFKDKINSFDIGVDGNIYVAFNSYVKKYKLANLFFGKYIAHNLQVFEIEKQTYKTPDTNIPIFREYKKHNSQWKLIFEDSDSGFVLAYNYGYVCGGIVNSNFTPTIDRMEFPLDASSGQSTSYITNLTENRAWSSGNNSSEHGYVHVGHSGVVFLDNCDKFWFTMSMGQLTSSGKLSSAKRLVGACNDNMYSYACGGEETGATRNNKVDRFTFPLEAMDAAIVISTLSNNKDGCSSLNSKEYGYVCGGANGPTISAIDRFTFSLGGSNCQQHGHLATGTWTSAAYNSSTFGYVCGGYQGSPFNTLVHSIQKILFPLNSGSSTILGNLQVSRRDTAANNSSEYGFCCGGRTATSSFIGMSSIERLLFNLDGNLTQIVSTLSTERMGLTGVDSTDFISHLV